MEELTTEVTEEDIRNGVEDEFGVVYSRDGKRLLKCENRNLKSYTIKEGTMIVCTKAFWDQFYLEQITIPNSVIVIGKNAFGDCDGLKYVDIPNSVTTIEDNAFSNCGLLKIIKIPNSVISMGRMTFAGCINLQKVKISASIKLISIGDGAFLECFKLRKIEIPKSIMFIGYGAFKNANNLKEIIIHNSVIEIRNSAFLGCSKLQQINLPDSLRGIGHNAFKNCLSLKHIELPKSLENIGENPFENCKMIELSSRSSRFVIKKGLLIDLQNNKIISCVDYHSPKIVIPKSITTIADSAFAYCENLKTIVIPKSVLNIGAFAFEYCTSLIGIKLPNNLTTINERTFKECYSLQTIKIPNSVTSIDKGAFSFCKSVIDINIPKSVSKIGFGAFLCCQSLKEIHLPETITTISESTFWGCESLETIPISNSITSIGDYAFGYCKSLKQLDIPNSVKTIGRNIVEDCNELKEYNIPEKFRPNMKIDKIVIHNFRAYINETIELKKFNCIIGKNDSGKSTIFAALEWFFNPQKDLDKYDFAASAISNDEEIYVEVYFSGTQMIPNCSKEEFIYDKDFLNSDGYLIIKKYIVFQDPSNRMGYKIKIYPFGESKEKILSQLTNDELFNIYGKMYSDELTQLDDLVSTLSGLDSVKLNEEERENYSKLYKMQIRNTKQKIFDKIYTNYKNNGIKPLRNQWIDFDNEQSTPFHLTWFESYKFRIFSSNTPISDYLNSLLSDDIYMQIEKEKTTIAKNIARIFNADENKNNSEKLNFKPNEQINIFNENSLFFAFNDSPIRVPLKNRGEGFQFLIKNAVFRLHTYTKSKNQKTIFAFEEPETHLHPSAQIEMYKTIKELSKNPNYQVFITTHSPYIVKQLAKDNINPIVVKRDENLKVSKISKLEERVLPYISMNEINYIAFDEPSIEYHIELFGFIQQKTKKNPGGVDSWLLENKYAKREYDYYQVDANSQLIPDKKGGFQHSDKTLPYCVRNQIDHPNDINKQYENRDYIRSSIDIMRNAILNNPDIFQKKE